MVAAGTITSLPTVIVTTAPGWASASARGTCSITTPSSVGSVVSCTNTIGSSPAVFRVTSASRRSSPFTSGTGTDCGPFDTSSVTRWPGRSSVPSLGSEPTMVSCGWFESTSVRPTTKPASCSCPAACSNVWPETLGTPTGFGPRDTLIRTFAACATFVPAFGSCAITRPAGLSDWISNTCGWRRAARIVAIASLSFKSFTSGTVAFGRPAETRMRTPLPFVIFSPAGGSWEMTYWAGTFWSATRFTSGVRFACSILATACSSRRPSTNGTVDGEFWLILSWIFVYP